MQHRIAVNCWLKDIRNRESLLLKIFLNSKSDPPQLYLSELKTLITVRPRKCPQRRREGAAGRMILVMKHVMLFPPESSCHQYTRAITYSYFCFLQETMPGPWPFQVIKHLMALFLLPLMLLEQTVNFALLKGQQPFWTTLVLTYLLAVHITSGHQLLFYRFAVTTSLSSTVSLWTEWEVKAWLLFNTFSKLCYSMLK